MSHGCGCRAPPIVAVDWRGHRHESRSLGTLLGRVGGWFSARHRAEADVEALAALLTIPLPSGRTVASELLLTASRPTLRLGAAGAPYEAKDRLRLRGYRWSAKHRVWQIETAEDQREAELAWLVHDVGRVRPAIDRVTWVDRRR